MSTIQSIHIAVISQTYSDVKERIINPTETDVFPPTGSIPALIFKALFFPSVSGGYAPVSPTNLTGTPTEIQGYKDILSLGNPKTISNNELLLSEIVLNQIEKPRATGTTTDGGLGVTRDMLTPCSLIALINSLQSLKYFSNLGAFTCALTWDEIETTVKSLAPPGVSNYSVLLKITVLLAPSSVSSIITPVALEYKFNVEFDV
jgi:hypothetical protein